MAEVSSFCAEMSGNDKDITQPHDYRPFRVMLHHSFGYD